MARGGGEGEFLLGDFAKLARFFALAQASDILPKAASEDEQQYEKEAEIAENPAAGDADA